MLFQAGAVGARPATAGGRCAGCARRSASAAFRCRRSRRGRMLAIDAGMALPPAAGYIENAGPQPRWRRLLVVAAGDAAAAGRSLRQPPAHPAAHGAHPSTTTRASASAWWSPGRGLAHHRAGAAMALYPGRAWRIPAGERHHFEDRDQRARHPGVPPRQRPVPDRRGPPGAGGGRCREGGAFDSQNESIAVRSRLSGRASRPMSDNISTPLVVTPDLFRGHKEPLTGDDASRRATTGLLLTSCRT